MSGKFFVNISNHPSSKWTHEQREAAEQIGTIIDIQFPQIPPTAGPRELFNILMDLERSIFDAIGRTSHKPTIHIMGEMGFTLMAVIHFKKVYGWKCVHSTTERTVIENPDGTKTSRFIFKQFREYLSSIEVLGGQL